MLVEGWIPRGFHQHLVIRRYDMMLMAGREKSLQAVNSLLHRHRINGNAEYSGTHGHAPIVPNTAAMRNAQLKNKRPDAEGVPAVMRYYSREQNNRDKADGMGSLAGGKK